MPHNNVLLLLSVLGMLTVIEFDNQAPLDTAKIDEIIANPMWSAEFEARKALGPEVAPQFLLLSGGLGRQPSAART